MFVLARSDGYDQGTPSGERVAPALVRQAAPQGGPAERPPIHIKLTLSSWPCGLQ